MSKDAGSESGYRSSKNAEEDYNNVLENLPQVSA